MTRDTSTLSSFVTRYARVIQQVRYRDVKALQTGPHAPLGSGGAATAFAIIRLGEATRIARAHARARAWLRSASHDRTVAAFRRPDGTTAGRGSMMFGRAGLAAVTAYAALAAGERRGYERARRAFVAARGGAELEVMDGVAGKLLGAATLMARHDDAALRAHGDALAESLAWALRRRTRRRWQANDGNRLAHGWAGVAYALATWQDAGELAPWLVDAGRGLARAWRVDAADEGLRGTWCNGAAGAALLWCRLFERTDARIFLRCAREAAHAATQHLPAHPHLCCGMGGVAYALLALDRVDPDGGWRARATAIAARAVAIPLPSQWPSGLLRGIPGVVCLALDALDPRPNGFPWFDPPGRRG